MMQQNYKFPRGQGKKKGTSNYYRAIIILAALPIQKCFLPPWPCIILDVIWEVPMTETVPLCQR
jgi:hypothetical protein